MTMMYSDIIKEDMRFFTTNNIPEANKWIAILDENRIRYKVTGHGNKFGAFYKFELIGYTKEEIEDIYKMIDYYFDEED